MNRELLNDGHRAELLIERRPRRAVLNEYYAASRAEAKARGLKFYFTGQPCRRGHKAVRLVSNNECTACSRLGRRRDRIANPMWAAFLSHRSTAKYRGIPFLFNYEQWRNWWLTDARWSRRGCGRDHLVMARRGDEGPYSPENVYCATASQNVADAFQDSPRNIARVQGLIRYTTEQPCIHGHVSERLVSNGACCVCDRLASKARKAKSRALLKAEANAKAGRDQLDAKPKRIKLRRSSRRIRPASSLSLFW